jgi:cytochrome c peroxidase
MKPSLAPIAFLVVAFAATPAVGQFIEPPPPPPDSLSTLAVPAVVERLSELPLVDESSDGAGGFVKNVDAAVLLGKALFWDQQMGSDGQACASCHYHAGADNREKNEQNQGANGVFDLTATGGQGPNEILGANDFPFHQLVDPNDRESFVVFDTDDVTSSNGTFAASFNDIIPGSATDDCTVIPSDPAGFHVNGINVRRVPGRNAPTVINAVFNLRSFWDGRANNIFNGVDPFGPRNVNARVLEVQSDTSVAQIQVAFENSSLASQSVGPPGSDFEMSCAGRSFLKMGKKMLSVPPLALQRVHHQDSVLGGLSAQPANGLTVASYVPLIQAAISDRFWDSDKLFDANKNESVTGEFTLMEANFSLIWGLSIQLYESTLISDQSPFDQFVEGNASALSNSEKAGMEVFLGAHKGQGGRCINCHQGPVFSGAAAPFREDQATEAGRPEQMVERMRLGNGDDIEEDLLRYFILGEGTVGGYTLSGQAGSRELPDSYPATVGGDFSVNSCQRNVYSYLMNQDTITFTPPGSPFPIQVPDTSTRDVVFVLRGCGEWLLITLIEGGPGADSATVQEIQPIIKQPPLSDPLPIPSFIGPPTSGPIVGDFTLNAPALYDTGFYNIGVRPTSEDIGTGGTDPWGNPLSFTRQWQAGLLGTATVDTFTVNPARFDKPFSWYGDAVFFPGGLTGPEWPIVTFFPCPPGPVPCTLGIEEGKGHGAVPKFPTGQGFIVDMLQAQAINDMSLAVDGSFKVPTLRNVELTGPFFHNGGQATLEQVVEFYNRGGDFAKQNLASLDPDIHPLNLSNKQQKDLVAFLKALTDNRVRCEQAPFDHPGITLPNGAKGGNVKDDGSGQAIENFETIKAVGANGSNKCLKGFLE